MSLPNEFLMQVNGHWDETYYLRREGDLYRLRESCFTDEEAERRHAFPHCDAETVEKEVKRGHWIITEDLDCPIGSSNIDLEEVL